MPSPEDFQKQSQPHSTEEDKKTQPFFRVAAFRFGMTGSKVIVTMEPDRRCLDIPKYDVTNYLKPQKREYLSEYKAVYRQWPTQKPRKSIRPQVHKIQLASCPVASDTVYNTDFAEPKLTIREKREKKKLKKELCPQYQCIQEEVRNGKLNIGKTTYTADFGPKEAPKRRPYTSAAEQTYKLPTGAFNAKSVYMESYLNYHPELVRACRQSPIKPIDALHSNTDCVKKEICPEPSPCPSEGQPNTTDVIPTVSPSRTESECKSNNSDSKQVVVTQAEEEKKQDTAKMNEPENPWSDSEPLQTTFMADYKPNWNVRKPALCRPEENNYREAAQFNGTTTTMAVYKAWPTSKPEMPPWAKKPVYKVPTEGMQLNSTYSMDFADPKVVPMVAAMIKPVKNENMIQPGGENSAFRGVTTYNQNYTEWRGTEPSRSYQVKSVYNPPREKMMSKSMYMTYYKGEAAKKSEIIRHASEHRQLNKDGKYNFNTTYKATYQDFRPKSSPGQMTGVPGKQVKKAWEDLSSKKELNRSCDSGIDMTGTEKEDVGDN